MHPAPASAPVDHQAKIHTELFPRKLADGPRMGRGPPAKLVVDERDSRKVKRNSFLVSEAPLEEKPSQELLRHPGNFLI